VSENSSFQEPNAVKAALDFNPPQADQNVTPSSLLAGGSGEVIPQLATWSLATWSRATGLLRAGYTDRSYSCSSCEAAANGNVNSNLATWGLATWG
jgi:hypothetical protein